MCVDSEGKNAGESIFALLQGEGVVGVSRLHTSLAFIGRTICTLVYTGDEVRVEVIDARSSAPVPFRGRITRPLRALRHFGPLASWERLRAAAFAAPSCRTNTCDGVTYCHVALDWQGGIEAGWGNPNWSYHRQQCKLAQAYRSLVEWSGIPLEQGTRVRVRTGLMAGLIGRVERLERYEGRLTVIAELGRGNVTLALAVSDVEFAPEENPEPNATADRPRE
jgi:hypothetical protein